MQICTKYDKISFMKSLFYIVLLLFAGKNAQTLNLSTFYTSSKNLKADEIVSSDFKQNDYVNSHKKNNVCWIETSVPANIISKEQSVLCFGQETFYQADVFIQSKNDEWIYIGKTGNGIKKADKTVDTWLNCIYLPQNNNYIDKNSSSLPVRIKIQTYHPSLVKIYFMSAKNYTSLVTGLTIIFSIIGGICISAIIFIIFTCVTFKEYDGIFLAFLCFSLILYIFSSMGIGSFYIWPFLTSVKTAYKVSYFTITTSYLCLIITLHRYYGKIPNIFPPWYYNFSNCFSLILISVFSAGLFLCILPIENAIFSFSVLSISFFLLIILLIQTYESIAYNPMCNIKLILIWIFVALLVFIQQCCLNFRFIFKNIRFFKLANQDLAMPQIVCFAVIAVSTLYKLNIKIRNRSALNQLTQKKLKEQVKQETKKNFIYSKLTTLLANPFQVIFTSFEKCKNKMSSELLDNVNESLNISRTLTYCLFALQNYECYPVNRRTDFEPIDLYTFIEETTEKDITTIKKCGTFLDVQKKILPGTCIFSNRNFLMLILKFPLQLAIKKTIPQTTLTVSYEYENYTFIYSIHFFSEPITRYESEVLLNLELSETEAEKVSKDFIENVINTWGVQMNVVKRIVELYNGQITIIPDSYGNTISIRLSLEPMPFNLHSFYTLEKFEKNSSSLLEIEEPKQADGNLKKIFILDENPDIQKIFAEQFSSCFKVFTYGSSYNLLKNIESESPDVIVVSLTISGTNTFELLTGTDIPKKIPFFVTAKNVCASTVIELLKMGATDVFQKPFNIELVLQRILAVIRNRNNYAKMLISSVNETLQNSLLGTAERKETESIEKFKEHADNTKQIEKQEKAPDNAAMNALFTSANLTEKEASIAAMVAASMSDKEIAAILKISPATVATHNKNIYKKIGIHSRHELIEKLK